MQLAGGETMGVPSEGEVAAVLAALAGVRWGDRVLAVGLGRIAQAALAAGCGQPLLDLVVAGPGSAAVAVVGDADALVMARSRVRPGGRLVAFAPDSDAAGRLATEARVTLRYTEAVGDHVAWSAQVPLEPAPDLAAP